MNFLWKVLVVAEDLLKERDQSSMEPTARATQKFEALKKAVSDVRSLGRSS